MTSMRIKELQIILYFINSNRLIVQLSFKDRIEIESVNRLLRNKGSLNSRPITSKNNRKSRQECSRLSTATTQCVFNNKMPKNKDKLGFKRLNSKGILEETLEVKALRSSVDFNRKNLMTKFMLLMHRVSRREMMLRDSNSLPSFRAFKKRMMPKPNTIVIS